MKYTNDVNELNKLLRSVLLTQSQLPNDKVLNSLSVYGEDLDKRIEEQQYESIGQNEPLLLFELVSNQNDEADISFDEDDYVVSYSSMRLNCIIYGNSSFQLAKKIRSRLLTEKVRNNLQSEGVHIIAISNPASINEYKNQSMWLRSDFQIDFNIQQIFEKIYEEDDIASIDTLSVLTVQISNMLLCSNNTICGNNLIVGRRQL